MPRKKSVKSKSKSKKSKKGSKKKKTRTTKTKKVTKKKTPKKTITKTVTKEVKHIIPKTLVSKPAPIISTVPKSVEIKMQPILTENFVSLQKAMVNLATKIDTLNSRVNGLLDLFEETAKSLAKKPSPPVNMPPIQPKPMPPIEPAQAPKPAAALPKLPELPKAPMKPMAEGKPTPPEFPPISKPGFSMPGGYQKSESKQEA